MTSLSGSASGLGDAVWPSIGCAQFEFLLLLPTAADMEGLGAAVSVSSRDAGAVLACAGKSGRSAPLVRTLGENAGASW